ncbi:retrovirus-related pol polyprotein from transposon TNT 1-94 [Tanacetum coccineum]
MNEDKIKKGLEEIETINIELDHMVSKLIAENENLKQPYKQLYDSIKPARIRSKEQCDDLINQVNLKSVEISNLNASLQEKVLEIIALKDDLRKLKGKALVDNVVTKHTIDPEMLKIDVASFSDNHDLCVLDFINDVNARTKSKSVKKSSKRKVWKPTRKVFTNIGYTWRPTDQTFTIVGNVCPLTRITTTAESKDKPPNFDNQVSQDDLSTATRCLQRLIKIDNGTEFVNQTLREYYEKVGISHETFVARSPQQNGVVERHNRALIEVARTMLIYEKASLFLWAEAVATACYTQNCSIIRLRHGKTSYELLHDKLPDLSFFHVFGALCYPTNDSENLDFDELTAMASEHSSLEPILHEMTPTTISLGLVPNPPPSTPFVPPSRTDWDILFQPLFDELLNPSSSVDRPASEVIALIAEVVAPEPVVSTGSPSSTTVNQDAP